MRAVLNHTHLYIFNAWSNGKKEVKNESQNGLTFNAMRAVSDPLLKTYLKRFP